MKLETLFNANVPIVRVTSSDESRALDVIKHAANAAKRKLHTWSVTDGCDGVPDTAGFDGAEAILTWALSDMPDDSILALLDFHHYLKDPMLVRMLRDFARLRKDADVGVVLVGPDTKFLADLEQDVVPFDIGMPDAAYIDRIINELTGEEVGVEVVDGDREALIKACLGLTHSQAENALAVSFIETNGKFDPASVRQEKERIVKESGVLEFINVPDTSAVGGLDVFRKWIDQRRACFNNDAREWGLPSPKGVLFVGPPGCGKSESAKVVARSWGFPLVRLDVSQLHGSLVGESEKNARRATDIADAIAPCILWIDELEKVLGGGSNGTHETSVRVLGHLLTWMQEHRTDVFVFATANNVSVLPPELLRKGRFDEVFACDLPSYGERVDIFGIHLRKRNRDMPAKDVTTLARMADGFSGAEIEAAVVDGMFAAYGEGCDLERDHVVDAIKATTPLVKTAKEDIEALRAWAQTRARAASSVKHDGSVPKARKTKARKTTSRRKLGGKEAS